MHHQEITAMFRVTDYFTAKKQNGYYCQKITIFSFLPFPPKLLPPKNQIPFNAEKVSS